ncbi:uncharacterized protein [Macrobrachium rosenbergii]|uniref:uncharacterized protein n=1 Tax=Macrobrachium rosenbergii TaxID=79674 RepID=UPI0034D47359
MPHHASPPTMGTWSAIVKSWVVWARVSLFLWVLGGWCFPVGGGAAAIPAHLTTEPYIYTGPTTTAPTPPPPPKDFEVLYKDVMASYINVTISYNATLNFTKINVQFSDPVDSSNHFISIPIGGNGVDPTKLFSPASGRLGFKYKVAGFRRRRRYIVIFTGFQGTEKVSQTHINVLSGNDDGEDSIYNLTGIFLVLGISTIIMVVVMVCVGYEKLIHNKSEECCAFLCCRRKKKKIPKASISPEPLMVTDGRPADETSSLDSNPRY